MNKKNRYFLLSASALAVTSAFAQEATELGSVVVSAARIEQKTLEAPASVSVVSRDALDAAGAVRVTDALTAKVPGMYMRGASGTDSRLNSAPIVSLRGQSQSRVKMMMDGVNLSDGNSGSLSSLLGVNLSDVERIEVVPGVGSALYGSDAIGGVVNIISKVPTKQAMTAKYSRGFGDGGSESGDREAYEARYQNRWENGLAVSIGLGQEKMSGFAKNDLVVLPVGTTGTGANAVQGGIPTTTTTGAPAYIVGNRGATTSEARYVDGKIYYVFDAQSKMFFGFAHSESAMGYQSYNSYLTKNGAPLALPASNVSIDGNKLGTVNATSFWNSSNPNERTENRYTAGYDGKLGNGFDLKVNLGYFDRESFFVSSGTGATFDGGPGTMTSSPNTTFDGSVQLGKGIGDQHYLIGGIASNYSTLNRKVYQVSNWRQPEGSRTGALNEESSGESSINALFIQDQFFLTDATTLYFGGRYDKWTTSGVAKKYVGTPIGTVDSPERSESAFTPKLAAVHRLTDTLSLRASWGTAFRAPSNFEMYATPNKSGNRLLIADPSLKPEKATSWDIGFEAALPSQGFFKAAYYDTKLTDMIYRKLSPHTGAAIVGVDTDATMTNAGEARVRGIELSGELALSSWLRAMGSYTYTDSKITRDESGTGLQGKVLRYVPKNMAYLGFNARWQDWQAQVNTTYTGLQFSSEDNSDVVKNVYGGVSKYWLTNLRVSYQISQNFKAAFAVNNVFDKQYYEYYQMPGRNAVLELSASF